MFASRGKCVGVNGAVDGCDHDDSGGESTKDQKDAGGDPPCPRASQKKNGPESEPGHVDDGAKGEEHPKRHGAPTVAFGPPQGKGSNHEKPHGDGPGQFMGATTAKPAVKGAETECQSDDGGGGGQSRVQGHAG